MESLYQQLIYENIGKRYGSVSVIKKKTIDSTEVDSSVTITILKAQCLEGNDQIDSDSEIISSSTQLNNVILRIVQSTEEANTFYQREIQACNVIQSLYPNENICQILHAFESVKQNTRYFVIIMPCYLGGDLNEYVEHMKTGIMNQFSTEVLFDLAFRLTRVLTVMHTDQRTVIHRDLSLHNILIEEIGTNYCKIRVIDFEQALLLSAQLSNNDEQEIESCSTSGFSEKNDSFSVGKLHINAPEVKYRNYSPHIDVWSLGCILYQIITQDLETILSKLSQSEIQSLIFERSDKMKQSKLAPFVWSCLQLEPERRMTSQHIMETLLMAWYFYLGDLKDQGQPEIVFQNCLLEGIYKMGLDNDMDVVTWMQTQKEHLPSELQYLADCICLLRNANEFGEHLNESPLAFLFIGMNMQDDQAAIEYYSKAIELNPTHPYVYVNRGFRYEKVNDYECALQDYRTAISLNPAEGKVYINRGNLYHNNGEYTLAIDDYCKAIEIDPNNCDVYFNRGLVYQTIGQLENALCDYTRAIELNPIDIPSLYRRGGIYLNLNMLDDSVNDFSAIIEQDEQDAESFHARGLCYLILEEYEKAINDFTTCMELDPNLASKTLFNRGKAYFFAADIDNAMQDFCKSIDLIELNPENANAYSYRALIYSSWNKMKEAIADLSNEIQLKNGACPQAFAQRGLLYSLQHDYTNAMNDLTKSIELAPHHGHAYFNRGHLYFLIGDYDKAILDYSRAIEYNPTVLTSYLERGRVYLKMLKYQSAISDFSFVIEKSNDESIIEAAREQQNLACLVLASQDKCSSL